MNMPLSGRCVTRFLTWQLQWFGEQFSRFEEFKSWQERQSDGHAYRLFCMGGNCCFGVVVLSYRESRTVSPR